MLTALFARAYLASLGVLLAAVPLWAQQPPPPIPEDEPDPAETARMRFGPIYLTPSLVFKNVGLDSNVFNESGAPKTDFTVTIGSQLSAGVRLGRGRLTADTVMDLVFYKKYRNQGSSNRRLSVAFQAPLNRLRPFAAAEVLQTRERPNNEIDLRAQRAQRTFSAGLGWLLTPRTELVFGVRRQTIGFEEGERFRGVRLREVLDETLTSASASVRMTLTPLTTAFVRVDVQRDRFAVRTDRDADSVRIAPGLEFKPAALLAGSVEVGYRRFQPQNPDLPPYTGLAAAAGLSYTLLGSTKFDVRLMRDAAYSFELLEPYYLSTGARLTVTQRLVGPFDLLAVTSHERLDYVELGRVPIDPRVDTARSVGAGIGIRLADDLRADLLAEFTERRSNVDRGRPYDGRRIFASFTYTI